MLNQVITVGRLVRTPELIIRDGFEYCEITIAVPRSFKNANGEYETDFINCELWKGIAENTTEFCQKGDLVGIRGRLQKELNQPLKVIAEKITFLSKGGEQNERTNDV